MKLTTNFSAHSINPIPYLLAFFWTLPLIAAVVGVSFMIEAVHLHKETPALQKRLAQLNAKRMQVTEVPLPAAVDLAALKQRIALMNSLDRNRAWPLPVLLTKLETWLPERAYLVHLRQQRHNGEVYITAEAESAEILTAFLIKLQKEEHFSEVLLTKQAQHAAPGGKRIQFDLRIRERI